MGLAIAEQLQSEFPGRVEGVQFTAPLKEQLAVLGKRRAEEGRVRLPESYDVRNSFTAMKKSVNAIGQARFDAEHDDRYGHGDHFWAYCLAEAAAEPPAPRIPPASLAEGAIFGRPRAPQLRPMARVAMF
jgi:phage FluMu gp28-like protein